MKRLDLDKAKEEGRRSNWNIALPKYDKETEDEIPHYSQGETEQNNRDSTSTLNPDSWETAIQEQEKYPIENDPVTAESDSLDDYGEDGDYENEGELLISETTGVLKNKVAKMLMIPLNDVQTLSERKVKVDLSFIDSPTVRSRVKGIVESVIKNFTSIPGKVETEVLDQRGIFTFNVTNPYLSSASGSPDVKTTSMSSVSEDPHTAREREEFIISKLMQGIVLIPKVRGIPKKTIRYGEYGLTKESVGKLVRNNPDISISETIMTGIKLTGQSRRVFNLYKLPSMEEI